jgi:hypothetical protein
MMKNFPTYEELYASGIRKANYTDSHSKRRFAAYSPYGKKAAFSLRAATF